jgi:HSP20 family protein
MVRIRRSPSQELTELHRRMERVMDNLLHGGELFAGARGWLPRADIHETKDAIQVTLELPGVQRDEIEITIEHPYLHVAGVRHAPDPEGCVRWHQMEISHGPFERIISLPGEVDLDRITANYQDGFLNITIPRKSPDVKQVPIRST